MLPHFVTAVCSFGRHNLNTGKRNKRENNLDELYARNKECNFRDVSKEEYNPVKNEKVITQRKELFADYELPI